ncbi:hypothetical protein UY3_05230 [Chelonia mydas]|uniref:Myb/SANT-like DNA-binding domain-containing protein n=1 Tax=Chelonia mydas TaxID=8469 RepID=M7BPC2_CHEMY|nr:hypothetical protein UY3_05230 [Chelonia mydas]
MNPCWQNFIRKDEMPKYLKKSPSMKDRGYNMDPQQFHVKIKELRQAYQKTREANGHSSSEPQTCRFHDELHAILGGADTTTPTLCFDSVQGVGGNTEAGFGGEEDEEEEVVDSSQQGSGETDFPNSQDLFITLDLDPVPPKPTQGGLPDPEGGEGTAGFSPTASSFSPAGGVGAATDPRLRITVLDHAEFVGSKAETLKRLANNRNDCQILRTKIFTGS